MRPTGSPLELERRRRLAVRRVAEGYAPDEVADFLGIDPRSVRRWLAAARHGDDLHARPAPGRPPKPSSTQEKVVRRWLLDNPTSHGFPTELWTTARLALLIAEEFGIDLRPHYLAAWLRTAAIRPSCRAASRANATSGPSPPGSPSIGPASSGRRAAVARPWFSWTRAACSWPRCGGAAGRCVAGRRT